MSKNLLAKYYREIKEKLQKKLENNMVENVTKISEDEKQKLVECRKKYYRMRKNA